VNLDSRISYRHGGRDPLPTDLVVTPPIKTLEGFDRDLVSNQKSVLRSTQQQIHHRCEAREEEPPWVTGLRGSTAAVGHARRSHRRLEQMSIPCQAHRWARLLLAPARMKHHPPPAPRSSTHRLIDAHPPAWEYCFSQSTKPNSARGEMIQDFLTALPSLLPCKWSFWVLKRKAFLMKNKNLQLQLKYSLINLCVQNRYPFV
jgi:hypothetical protein